MVQEEVQNKTAKGSSSCTNGLLWLTRLIISLACFAPWSACLVSDIYLLKVLHVRAMDFLVELFRNLLEHPDWTMSQACTDSYTKTLKKFHGWLASSSFTVVVSLYEDPCNYSNSNYAWQNVFFKECLAKCYSVVVAQEIIISIWT
jgi:hypothetical protein